MDVGKGEKSIHVDSNKRTSKRQECKRREHANNRKIRRKLQMRKRQEAEGGKQKK